VRESRIFGRSELYFRALALVVLAAAESTLTHAISQR